MNYLLEQLSKIYETKEEHIDRCKKSFLNMTTSIQCEIQEASTDELLDELKRHTWSTTFDDYCDAIRYELMLRGDFEDEF